MQVFKLYIKLYRSIAPVLIFITLLFTIILAVNSFTKNNLISGFEQTKVRTAIVNYDKDSPLVKDFLNYLGNFYELEDFTDRIDQLDDALFFGDITYIITIPYDFSEDLLAGKDISVQMKSLSDDISSITVNNTVNNYFNMAGIYIKEHPGNSEMDISQNIQKEINTLSKVTVIQTENNTNDYDFNNQYYNIIAFVMTICCLLGIGYIMISFQTLSIQRRNMIAPIRTGNINLQLLLGNILFVFLYDIFFILAGYIMNTDKMFNVNILFFGLNLFVFSISILTISYIVIHVVKNRQAVYATTFILTFILCFISGVFIPQSSFSNFILKLAAFSPVFWFVKANNTIAALHKYDWSNLQRLFYYILIQLGFSAVFFAISLVLQKNKLLKE
jgi:ABC-2 type transport system permease protein